MTDEHDDDLAPEVDDAAEIETENFAEVDDEEDDELRRDTTRSVESVVVEKDEDEI